MFYSDDRQDEFCATLLKFKRDGTYVDIGSCASRGSNNSYYLEKELGWKGICIEKNPQFNDSYKDRVCRFINQDALTIDYEALFKDELMPQSIDYLSLDIDEASVSALKLLPLDKYRFKVITIETDSHVYGDLYRAPQREILLKHGYFLLGEDMLNQSGRNIGAEHGWEDWYVDPKQFDEKELREKYSYRSYTDELINKFK